MKKILVLAANPRKDLNLDREIRDLQGVIERSQNREQFEVIPGLAVRVGDLQELLFKHKPQIVHFCGHGSGEQGLVFEGDNGGEQWVGTDALSELFRLFNSDVECVLLNACYSEEQANAIVDHIDYVIGMNQEIRDDAAIAFSKGFYRALGYNCPIEKAYEFGRNAIQLEISGSSKVRTAETDVARKLEVIGNAVAAIVIPEHLKPILKQKQSLVIVPSSAISEETQASIQLDIHRSLEVDPSVKQYREQVREYLADRRLEDFEIDLLEECRIELGLSSEKAKDIIREEIYPIEQAKQAYVTRLKALIKYYPFSEAIENELKKFQSQRHLTDGEIKEISQPIIETAKIAYQKTLNQNLVVNPEEIIEKETQQTQPQIIPSISLDSFDGLVSLDSPFYIERHPIERDCYATIIKPGALIRIKAPRQMGKSSLMQRILHYATQKQYQTAYINFQLIEPNMLTNLDLFLQWFCSIVTDSLDMEDKVEEMWKQGVLGAKEKCTNYFRRYLLKEISHPITLGLDEVDQVFQHLPIADGFFSLLRVWHEKSKSEELWKNLRLVLAHSKEVYIPLNINQSPFNVGLPIEPGEFTQVQVIDLVQRHGIDWTISQIEQLMSLVDGHPYLLRKALYEIAGGNLTLEKFIQIAPTDEGPYYDHLRRHLFNLKNDPVLEESFKKVIMSDVPVRIDSTQAFKLRSMGLINFQGNDVIPLCNLYRTYFCDQLAI